MNHKMIIIHTIKHRMFIEHTMHIMKRPTLFFPPCGHMTRRQMSTQPFWLPWQEPQNNVHEHLLRMRPTYCNLTQGTKTRTCRVGDECFTTFAS